MKRKYIHINVFLSIEVVKSYTHTKAKATQIRRRKPYRYKGESHTIRRRKPYKYKGESHTKAEAIQIQRRKPYEGESHAKLNESYYISAILILCRGLFFIIYKIISIHHIQKTIQVHINNYN